jgi:hypothetical protein
MINNFEENGMLRTLFAYIYEIHLEKYLCQLYLQINCKCKVCENNFQYIKEKLNVRINKKLYGKDMRCS